MRVVSRGVVVMVVVAIGAFSACGTSSGSDGTHDTAGQGTAAGSGASGGSAGQAGGDSATIPCTAAEWTQSCGSSCPFAAGDIDCAMACKHLASVCATGCPQCMGMNLDEATCMAGCGTYKGVTCFNRLLGCFVSNDSCQGVTACAGMHP